MQIYTKKITYFHAIHVRERKLQNNFYICCTLIQNKAIVNSRLCSKCHNLTNSTKHCSNYTEIIALVWAKDTDSLLSIPKYQISVHWSHGMNVTSSIKLEVHNILQCRQRRTKPLPQAICIKIWLSSVAQFSGYVTEQTDKSTHTHTKKQEDTPTHKQTYSSKY